MKRKNILIAAAAMVMTLAMSMTALAEGWVQDAKGWYYIDERGNQPKNEWRIIDGNKDGTAEYYYFGEDGYMLADTTTPDGSQVDADGKMLMNGVPIVIPVSVNAEIPAVDTSNVNGATDETFDSQKLADELNTYVTYFYSRLMVDPSRPALENGVSNIRFYGDDGSYTDTFNGRWVWLNASDFTKGLKSHRLIKAYCFSPEGYLYVSTITPDGFTVNEHGELTVDGTVVMHTTECRHTNPYTGAKNVVFGAGEEPIGLLSYDHTMYYDYRKGPNYDPSIYVTSGFTYCIDNALFER